MDAFLNGSIFCGHTEGIPSDGMDDIQSFHEFMTGNHIHDGKIPNMSHVNAARGIRIHFQAIAFRSLRIVVGFKDVFFLPDLLPLPFDPVEIVGVFHFGLDLSFFIVL
jgi:hypothetical protein